MPGFRWTFLNSKKECWTSVTWENLLLNTVFIYTQKSSECPSKYLLMKSLSGPRLDCYVTLLILGSSSSMNTAYFSMEFTYSLNFSARPSNGETIWFTPWAPKDVDTLPIFIGKVWKSALHPEQPFLYLRNKVNLTFQTSVSSSSNS